MYKQLDQHQEDITRIYSVNSPLNLNVKMQLSQRMIETNNKTRNAAEVCDICRAAAAQLEHRPVSSVQLRCEGESLSTTSLDKSKYINHLIFLSPVQLVTLQLTAVNLDFEDWRLG